MVPSRVPDFSDGDPGGPGLAMISDVDMSYAPESLSSEAASCHELPQVCCALLTLLLDPEH